MSQMIGSAAGRGPTQFTGHIMRTLIIGVIICLSGCVQPGSTIAPNRHQAPPKRQNFALDNFRFRLGKPAAEKPKAPVTARGRDLPNE